MLKRSTRVCTQHRQLIRGRRSYTLRAHRRHAHRRHLRQSLKWVRWQQCFRHAHPHRLLEKQASRLPMLVARNLRAQARGQQQQWQQMKQKPETRKQKQGKCRRKTAAAVMTRISIPIPMDTMRSRREAENSCRPGCKRRVWPQPTIPLQPGVGGALKEVRLLSLPLPSFELTSTSMSELFPPTIMPEVHRERRQGGHHRLSQRHPPATTIPMM